MRYRARQAVMERCFGYKYLSQSVINGFDNYKYSSVDSSPLSNYISHPLWNQAVKLFPLWVAPNIMTLAGFLMVMSGYFLIAAYDYDFTAADSHPVPNWLWLYCAIATFVAHVLDGIDGKQARRTGTSGPTGELFDHGCDSWSTLPFTVTLFTAFGRGQYSVSPTRLLGVLASVQLVFIVSHWEKYNTGVLFLSWAYDVSQYGLALFYLATFIMGYDYWRFFVRPGLPFAVILEVGFYVMCIISVIVSLYNTYHSYYVTKTGLQPNAYEGFRPMIPFIGLTVVSIVWGHYSDVIEKDPRAFIWLNGTIFSNIATRLIISQMSKTQAEAWNSLLYPLSVAGILGVVMPHAAWQLPVVYVLMVFVTVAHIHYGVCVVNQLCDHFNIKPFSIAGRINPPADSTSAAPARGPSTKSDYNVGTRASIEQQGLLDDDDDEDVLFNEHAPPKVSSPARNSRSPRDNLQSSITIPNAHAL